jgi:hypothetical protein
LAKDSFAPAAEQAAIDVIGVVQTPDTNMVGGGTTAAGTGGVKGAGGAPGGGSDEAARPSTQTHLSEGEHTPEFLPALNFNLLFSM